MRKVTVLAVSVFVLSVGGSARPRDKSNASGATLHDVSIQRNGRSVSFQAGGARIDACITPFPAKISTNRKKAMLVIGPSGVVKKVASARARANWRKYE